MSIKMLINAHRTGQLRIAVIEENNLSAYQVDVHDSGLTRGNIYRGVVANIQPSLNAAFVDIGEERHGFLPIGDLLSSSWHRQPPKDERRPRIDQVLERGRPILVQVTKDGIGQKGPALTTNIALAGRYLVLMPFDDVRGISRKANDDDARKKVRERLADLSVPEGQGVIVRTNGIDQNKTTLSRDLNALQRLWRRIRTESSRGKGARLIYSDQDLIQQALRDYLDNTVEQVIVDADEAHEQVETYMKAFMPRSKVQLIRYTERIPLFTRFQLEPQIERIYERTVPLPNGGSIVIDNTEALTAVDVNSGRATMYGDHEETVLNVNVEAAREVARQLRLRDIGGLVVIDFIDMRLRKSQRKLEKEMRDAMKGDKARYGVSRISANGLVEINRQRIKQALRLRTHRSCPTCNGIGSIANPDFAAIRMLRHIEARAANGLLKSVLVALHPEVADALQNHHRQELAELEKEFDIQIEIVTANNLSHNEERVEWTQRSKTNGRGPVKAALSSLDLAPDPKQRGQKDEDEKEAAPRRRRRRGGRRRRRSRGDQISPEEHQQQQQLQAAKSQGEDVAQSDQEESQETQGRRPRSRRRRRRSSSRDQDAMRGREADRQDQEAPASEPEGLETQGEEVSEPTEESAGRRRRRGSRGGRGRRSSSRERIGSRANERTASRTEDQIETAEAGEQQEAKASSGESETRRPRRRRFGSTSRAAARAASEEAGTEQPEAETKTRTRRPRRPRRTEATEEAAAASRMEIVPAEASAPKEASVPAEASISAEASVPPKETAEAVEAKPVRRRRRKQPESVEAAGETTAEATAEAPKTEEEKPKKQRATRTRRSRSKVTEEASEIGVDGKANEAKADEPEKKAPPKRRRRKAVQPADSVEPAELVEAEEAKAPKTTRRRRKAVAKTEPESDSAEIKAKPTRRRRKTTTETAKAGGEAATEVATEAAPAEAQPADAKPARRRRKTATKAEAPAVVGEEAEKKPTRRRTTRRKAATQEEPAKAADGEEKPKPRRTRKKATEPAAPTPSPPPAEAPQWSWLGGTQEGDEQD